MKPVIVHSEAEDELVASVDFYESRWPGLGLEFESEARATIQKIQSDPDRHPPRANGTRRVVMERFPFAVHYAVVADTLWILAFAHTSRKPGYWRQRL